jgi:activating signal cointegrator complex subunit 2
VAQNILITGSDYLDSLYAAYKQENEQLRKAPVANVYVGLTSLRKTSQSNTSLLLGHLFSLKAYNDLDTKTNTKLTLPADLIANASFLAHLFGSLQTSNQDRARARPY